MGGLSAFGLFGVVPISIQHVTGIELCPMLGFVPACYVVLLGYVLIGASTVAGVRFRTMLFVTGWLPVIGLALMGSSMEVLGYEACPRSADNVPTCFFSLAIAMTLVAAFLLQRSTMGSLSR